VGSKASKRGLVLPRKILIIGANAAGINAASAARKTDREAEITLITDEEYPAYSRCGLPFVLAGDIPSFENLIIFPTSYYRMMRLDLRTDTKAKTINPRGKTVLVKGKDEKQKTMEYDSLILTTGAESFCPPIKGRDKDGVLSLRTIEEGKHIHDAMKRAKKAVVVGAGFIGLEMAHAFAEKNIETTIVEMLPCCLPAVLDEDMADLVRREIERHNVRVIVGKGVDEILGDGRVTGVFVAGEEIPADIVLLACGVRARNELAEKAGIEMGATRAIKVSHRMETSMPDIYAAGDCIESTDMITGRPTLSQLGTTAVRQGKVAGINAAGGYSIFPGVLGSAVTRIFGFEVGATGLTESRARAGRVGLKTVSGKITAKTKPEYFPGGKEITVKIVIESESERIVGGQIVGGEGVAQRINMISLAIQKGATVWDLGKADTCYAPPVADTWEPVALASELAGLKIRR